MKKFWKLISYYKPYKLLFCADMFFSVLDAATALVFPLIIRYITSDLIFRGSEEIMSEIFIILGVMLALLAVSCYSRFFVASRGHVMGTKIERDMRNEIFAHFQKLPFSFYDNRKVGLLMSRVTNDLFEITELMHHGPETLIISFIKITGALVILLLISPPLALAAFIILPFMMAFAFVVNTWMRRAFKKNREKVAEINAAVEDNLSGIRVVKSFANEDVEREKFTVANEGFVTAKKNSYFFMGIFHSGLGTFTTLIQVSVIFVGTLLIAGTDFDVNDLVTFLLYISIFTEPVRTLASFIEQFQNGFTGFERFCEIIETVPEIRDAEGAQELTSVRGDIDLEDVSFSYTGYDEVVLDHVNVHIPAGSYTALVGSSGAGKTTLCSLIPRFYDVTGGAVKVDGKDVRGLTQKSLREHIGTVAQDVYLFSGTVYENIVYGKPGATEEEVIEAAKNANAHEFIMSLPNGYNTDIGQRGVKLSGGQKQRLSIARVFLKNPPILIFDEATSALDNESERVVQESFERLAKNRTTLVIAHRLSTIRNAERIIVMSERGIEEEGTHEELLARNGEYAKLYNMQFR